MIACADSQLAHRLRTASEQTFLLSIALLAIIGKVLDEAAKESCLLHKMPCECLRMGSLLAARGHRFMLSAAGGHSAPGVARHLRAPGLAGAQIAGVELIQRPAGEG